MELHRLESRVLAGNPWGDPADRDLPVYLPPSGQTDGVPLLVLLAGFSGTGHTHLQRNRFLDESTVGRLDRLIRTHRAPEAMMVAPDCLTSLGGSQYLNSSATGRYEDYVVTEIVPWVRERFRTGPTAVLGTSSGGYGALVLGMRHPDVFRAVVSNAGDAYFEYCYPPDFPTAFREIQRAGGPEAYLRSVFEGSITGFGPNTPMGKTVSTMAYASAYSPTAAEPGRFELPFDLEDGSLRTDVWSRWLACDPVRLVAQPEIAASARRLRWLHVDGGSRDEFGLDVSARIFASAARRSNVPVEFETYDGAHFGPGPRYETLLPRLLERLTAGP